MRLMGCTFSSSFHAIASPCSIGMLAWTQNIRAARAITTLATRILTTNQCAKAGASKGEIR
jgi:hypothetical protein